MWKYYSEFIDHPPTKHFIFAHGASHQALTSGPPPSKSVVGDSH